MTMGEALLILTGLVILLAGLPALLVVTSLLLPDVTDSGVERLREGVWLPALVGAGVLTLLIGLMAIFEGIGFGLFTIWAGLGLATVSRLLGERLSEAAAAPVTAFRELGQGAALLTLAALVPVVGWFMVLPLAVVLGGGANILTLYTRFRDNPPRIVRVEPVEPVEVAIDSAE